MTTTSPAPDARPGRHLRAARLHPVGWARWVALCAAAETVGMTAAAATATTGNHTVGEPSGITKGLAVLGLALLGGAVEGLAVSYAMWTGLGARGSALTRRRWTTVTTVAALVGWSVGTVPAAFSGSSSDSSQPAWLLVVAGALAMGVGMGALLGGVQARVLRGHVRHHRRWVMASCLGWAPAMVVIFVGATWPDASWPPLAVIATGTVTGAVAGVALGAVTGLWLPSLDGPSVADRVVMHALGSPTHRMFSNSLLVLRMTGRRTGGVVDVVVQHADIPGALVAVAGGDASRKSWWRNVIEPRPVDVLLHGEWWHGTAVVVRPEDPGYAQAVAAYEHRWPRTTVARETPVVRVDLG